MSELKEIYNDEYIVLGNYVDSKTKIKVKHNVKGCKKKIHKRPDSLLAGQGCYTCERKKRKKTLEQFKEEVKKLTDDEYLVVGNYINTNEKIKMKHNTKECGNTWDVYPYNFLNGGRCPLCKESKGEKRIRKYLEKNNIKFVPQKKFDDCKAERRLPFDFAVYKDDSLVCLIEYDGQQHFRPFKYFGGEEKFKIRKERDEIKTSYCLQNNLKLIRIPYWEINKIEERLKDAL